MSSSYIFDERAELDVAVALWISDESAAIDKYGDINTWNVRGITDFSRLFFYTDSFNSDIGNWDVSKGTNFSRMFSSAFREYDIGGPAKHDDDDGEIVVAVNSLFNQDISRWDVHNGTDFSYMFYGAKAFNQDISSWNVANGENFRKMFEDPGGGYFHGGMVFNQDLSVWNVSSGNNFDDMFWGNSAMKANGFEITPSPSDFLGKTLRGNNRSHTIEGVTIMTFYMV